MIAMGTMTALLPTLVVIGSLFSRHVFAVHMQSSGSCRYANWGHHKVMPGSHCRQYYTCTPAGLSRQFMLKFKWVPMKCAKGTIWDSVTAVCNYAAFVTCVDAPVHGNGLSVGFPGKSFHEIVQLEGQKQLAYTAEQPRPKYDTLAHSDLSNKFVHSGALHNLAHSGGSNNLAHSGASNNLANSGVSNNMAHFGASNNLAHSGASNNLAHAGTGASHKSSLSSGSLSQRILSDAELTSQISQMSVLDGFGMSSSTVNFGPPYANAFGNA